jgi:hypothetical protein
VAGAFSLRTHGWLALHPHSLAASRDTGNNCCFFALAAAQWREKMSCWGSFQSRGDKNAGPSDIFSRLSDACFEKEKFAFTFPNNVNTLVRGVEGGLATSHTVSVVVSVQRRDASGVMD